MTGVPACNSLPPAPTGKREGKGPGPDTDGGDGRGLELGGRGPTPHEGGGWSPSEGCHQRKAETCRTADTEINDQSSNVT